MLRMGKNEKNKKPVNQPGKDNSFRKSNKIYKMPIRGMYYFFFKGIFEIKIKYHISENI